MKVIVIARVNSQRGWDFRFQRAKLRSKLRFSLRERRSEALENGLCENMRGGGGESALLISVDNVISYRDDDDVALWNVRLCED